jgi:hypothetical protein
MRRALALLFALLICPLALAYDVIIDKRPERRESIRLRISGE